jgi:apyrase
LLFFIKQVTLVTSEPVPVEFSQVLKFGDVSYNLYSHSFLQLGLVSCVRKY